MSTITVNQASDYTVMRDSIRMSQRKINYADLVLYVHLKSLDSLAECNAITNIEAVSYTHLTLPTICSV